MNVPCSIVALLVVEPDLRFVSPAPLILLAIMFVPVKLTVPALVMPFVLPVISTFFKFNTASSSVNSATEFAPVIFTLFKFKVCSSANLNKL